ncbi:MAG: CotH kinase family protein, partial [Clostridia bacterium]|nr:CotH kinase family protein [Clostridia bacterium]
MRKRILTLFIVVMSVCMIFACKHEHEFSQGWSADETHHYHQCSCGEKTDLMLHNFDNGTTISQPTLEVEGVKLYTCVTCGKTKTEPIEKLYECTITVSANMPNAVTFTTPSLLTQTVSAQSPDYQKVNFTTNFGYKYICYEVGGQRCFDTFVDFDEVKENKEVQLIFDYATDELPVINVDTDGAEINSKQDYVDMSFSIENCDDAFSADGGIRLRGNSTLKYDKKAYRIKFDKKQSFFGLKKAKSWVLL